MKKITSSIVLAGLLSLSSSAGVVQWGSFLPDYSDYVSFTDNNDATFTGYAYLFLLSSEGGTVSWNSTTASWDLNGAEQILVSPAASLDGVAGTWGALNDSVGDTKLFGDRNYQVILTTATGNADIKSITTGNGFWVSTSAQKLENFTQTYDAQTKTYVDKSGSVAWQSPSGSWAPVAAVPEPATMALFGLGGLALVIRRKLRKEA